MIVPSAEQQAIIDLGLTSIRVSAGAGTGKTTTVAMVIANLIAEHDLEPEQVLGITFTNKAAAELVERVNTTVGLNEPGRQVEIHTYHGFAAQVLSEFGPIAGVDSRLRVITPTFARQLMSETFHHSDFQHLDITQTRSLDKVARLGDRLGDHLLTAEQILESAVTNDVEAQRREMAQILDQYARDKRALRVVDYSDLVSLATRIVSTHPDLASVIRDRYRVVVLDEYQDTNPAQRALLTAIFTDGFPAIAVGDRDQTIYEWRGASTENFEMFPDHFRTAEGELAHHRGLTLNRRSIQKILNVANRVRALAGDDPEDLVSHQPEDETGEVATFWGGDALEEAEWIATRFEQLHSAGHDWDSMAVLFRKNKDFAILIDTFNRHDIPVEVANIGGLLSVPEVADLRAWLEILDSPGDSAALIRVLFGSKYRLGMADLAIVTRGMARIPLHQDEADPVTLIEAIESDINGLRPDARDAIDHFRNLYRKLVLESQGMSLVEVCRLVLEYTGSWGDVEALPDNQRLTARLNLYRMLDLAEDWSPLRGRPSLHAFLEYLDAMESEPGDDIDAARLSGEKAVTMITVHRAKGLEWDSVALPALTQRNFPSQAQQHSNPLKFPEFVPASLRIDRVFDGVPTTESDYQDHVSKAHQRQEWRTAYVAVTRARRRLYASGAFWYGHPEPNKTPAKPSELWEIIHNSPESTGEAPGEPTERPLVLRPPSEGPAPDPVFPGGWQEALRSAIVDPGSIDQLADQLGVSKGYDELVTAMNDRLFVLAEPRPERAVEVEKAVSVTGLVTYAQCPKAYFWTSVDPLPRRSNPAARRGTEIHRQIELHQRGHVPLDLVDHDLYDDPIGDSPGAFDTYMESRFARQRATLIEAPFTFDLETGYRVRGRIDAVYVDDGNWEVVDFKSGRLRNDPARTVQLQAYAVAVADVDFGLPPPQHLAVTFAYLGGGGGEISHTADEFWIGEARSALEQFTDAIGREQFTPQAGEWCSGCDFLRFCAPGKDFLAG